MDFRLLQVYTNYMDAHILKGRLEEEGIQCWLKDENTVTIDPILTHAIGGIKLMVEEERFEDAEAIMNSIEAERRANYSCPKCGSSNIEFVTTPTKVSNWLGALGGTLLGDFAMGAKKVWKCFNCGEEFETPTEKNPS